MTEQAMKGELESTPDEILSMVKSLASPPHHILVFLQQSSVEWCSSLWLDAIREIDPTFRRIVIVVSKFHNRLKEFSDGWEVDRYLSAGGYLGENSRPFFVALRKDSTTFPNEEFHRQISQVDSEVLRYLRESVKGGFDEEKYKPFIRFNCLKEYLESELQKSIKKQHQLPWLCLSSAAVNSRLNWLRWIPKFWLLLSSSHVMAQSCGSTN